MLAGPLQDGGIMNPQAALSPPHSSSSHPCEDRVLTARAPKQGAISEASDQHFAWRTLIDQVLTGLRGA